MKISRIIIIVLVIVIVALLAVFLYESTVPRTNSVWLSGAQYPLQIGGTYGVSSQSCVNSTGYIYCIGGTDANNAPRSEVYSSTPLTSSSPNVTSWTSNLNSYPQNINIQSCVAYSNYLYCVGGSNDAGGDDIASSYYAPLNGNGVVGSWNSTTAYPIAVDTQFCVASSGYIYCVAGNNETDGTYNDIVTSSSVWFAPLSTSGIGTWKLTTSYPGNIYDPSCFGSSGYVYCLGGIDSGSNSVSTAYYASLSSTGVGAWTQTTAYPQQLTFPSCSFASGYLYCVGGQTGESSYTNAVYYAPVSSAGIGTWKSAPTYPTSVATNCAISSGYMYCVGGADGSSVGENAATFYTSLSSLSSGSTG